LYPEKHSFWVSYSGRASGITLFLYRYSFWGYKPYYYRLQPFTFDTLKVIAVIIITGLAVYFIPSVNNVFADIAIRSSLTTVIFGGLVYALKIVPEFHHLIPFLNKKK